MPDKTHPPLCLFGAGGHGKVVASFARSLWQAPLCFADNSHDIGTRVSGLLVEFQSIEDIRDHSLIVTIGVNKVRETLQNRAQDYGLEIATLVSDQAIYMTDIRPGLGTLVFGGGIVNADAKLGKGVIINSNAVVEHDCQIGDFCHIAPGAVALGGCMLGDRVWLGANATVLQNVTIASDCIISAGAVVTSDISQPGVYAGNPAQHQKFR